MVCVIKFSFIISTWILFTVCFVCVHNTGELEVIMLPKKKSVFLHSSCSYSECCVPLGWGWQDSSQVWARWRCPGSITGTAAVEDDSRLEALLEKSTQSNCQRSLPAGYQQEASRLAAAAEHAARSSPSLPAGTPPSDAELSPCNMNRQLKTTVK